MAILTVIFVREKPWDPATLSATTRNEQRHTVRDLTLTVLATVAVTGLALLVVQLVPNVGLTADALSVIQLLAVVVAGIGAARAFGFRPRKNPDFSWVVLTRMLVVMGVQIVQTFLTFYMKDVVHAGSPESAATLFVIILTFGAMASTVLAGWASDRVGRKRMVYISGAFMAAVGAAFIFAPYLVTDGLLTVILIAGGDLRPRLRRLPRRGLGAGGGRVALRGDLRARHGRLEHRADAPTGAGGGLRRLAHRRWVSRWAVSSLATRSSSWPSSSSASPAR